MMFDFLKRMKHSDRDEKHARDAEAARRLATDGPKGVAGTTGQRPLNGGQAFPPPPTP